MNKLFFHMNIWKNYLATLLIIATISQRTTKVADWRCVGRSTVFDGTDHVVHTTCGILLHRDNDKSVESSSLSLRLWSSACNRRQLATNSAHSSHTNLSFSSAQLLLCQQSAKREALRVSPSNLRIVTTTFILMNSSVNCPNSLRLQPNNYALNFKTLLVLYKPTRDQLTLKRGTNLPLWRGKSQSHWYS